MDSQRRSGLILVTAAALAFSTAGFFTRLITADTWTMLFWRSLFSTLLVGGVLVWRNGRGTLPAFRRIGRPGAIVVVLSSVSMVAYLSALRLTTVAEVAVVYATLPLFAAGAAWLFLRERPTSGTLAASLVALLGVLVMVGGSGLQGDPRGLLVSFLMTATIAVSFVVLRQHREVPMVPAVCLSTLLTAVVSLPFASPLQTSGPDLFYLFLFGGVQMALGFVAVTIGSQRISPIENALIGTLDAPLAPIWVWLAFAEAPTGATLIGGGVVLAAVVGHLLLEGRARPAAGPPAQNPSSSASSRVNGHSAGKVVSGSPVSTAARRRASA